jgi:hypothetical protein
MRALNVTRKCRGISVKDFVQESFEREVQASPAVDPLFADAVIFRDDGPTDSAAQHDKYLYGEEP